MSDWNGSTDQYIVSPHQHMSSQPGLVHKPEDKYLREQQGIPTYFYCPPESCPPVFVPGRGRLPPLREQSIDERMRAMVRPTTATLKNLTLKPVFNIYMLLFIFFIFICVIYQDIVVRLSNFDLKFGFAK